jgi:hypothetical protein
MPELENCLVEITPVRILLFYQSELPGSIPFLKLLLTKDRVIHVVVEFEIHQSVDAVFLSESLCHIVSVLPDPGGKIAGDGDVQRSIAVTSKYVDGRLLHGFNNWIPACAGMTCGADILQIARTCYQATLLHRDEFPGRRGVAGPEDHIALVATSLRPPLVIEIQVIPILLALALPRKFDVQVVIKHVLTAPTMIGALVPGNIGAGRVGEHGKMTIRA